MFHMLFHLIVDKLLVLLLELSSVVPAVERTSLDRSIFKFNALNQSIVVVVVVYGVLGSLKICNKTERKKRKVLNN